MTRRLLPLLFACWAATAHAERKLDIAVVSDDLSKGKCGMAEAGFYARAANALRGAGVTVPKHGTNPFLVVRVLIAEEHTGAALTGCAVAIWVSVAYAMDTPTNPFARKSGGSLLSLCENSWMVAGPVRGNSPVIREAYGSLENQIQNCLAGLTY